MAAQQSLFDRIGGKDAVKATVTKLYGKVLTDPLLSPFFKGTQIEQLKRSQIAFVTMAFGGPHNYTGKNMRDAHAPLVKQGLTDKHFDAVAEHLINSMKELSVHQDLIDEAIGIVATTRNDVLGR